MRLAAVLAGMLLATGCSMAPTAREEAPRAAVVAGWPIIPADAKFGQVSAVDVAADGRVFVLHRAGRAWSEPFPAESIAEPTVFVFDGSSGRLLARWGAGEFIMPHGLSIDPEGKVWITDAGREQVFRFSPEGKLELTLGERSVSGSDANHFGRPTDIAFGNGRVLVADGYINSRIAIFDRSGRFVGQFGSKGGGDGQFAIPHSIASGAPGLVVADRENARIQSFTSAGSFAGGRSTPNGGHPYSAKPLPDGGVVTLEGRDGADRGTALLRFWSADGTLERTLDASALQGPTKGHDLAVGPDGAIYLADVDAGRVLKLAPQA